MKIKHNKGNSAQSIIDNERRIEYEGEDKQDKRTLAELNKIKAEDRKVAAEKKMQEEKERQQKAESKIIEKLSNPNKLDNSEFKEELEKSNNIIINNEKELLQSVIDPYYLDEIDRESARQIEEERQIKEARQIEEEAKQIEEERQIKEETRQTEKEEASIKNNVETDDNEIATINVTDDTEDDGTDIIEEQIDDTEDTEDNKDTEDTDDTEDDEIIDFGDIPETDHIEQETDHIEQETDHTEPETDHIELENEHIESETDHTEPETDHIEQETDHIESSIDFIFEDTSTEEHQYNRFIGEDEIDLNEQHLYLNEGRYKEPVYDNTQSSDVDDNTYKIRVSSDEITGYSDRLNEEYKDNDNTDFDYAKQIEEYTQHMIEEAEAYRAIEEAELDIYNSALEEYCDSILQEESSSSFFEQEGFEQEGFEQEGFETEELEDNYEEDYSESYEDDYYSSEEIDYNYQEY